jgi:hypothetical protein
MREICKKKSIRAVLSIGILLGNLEGCSFPGAFERRDKFLYLG